MTDNISVSISSRSLNGAVTAILIAGDLSVVGASTKIVYVFKLTSKLGFRLDKDVID